MTRYIQLTCVLALLSTTSAALAQIDLSAFATSGSAGDNDSTMVPMPGSGSVSAFAEPMPPGFSFATATASATVTGNQISTSGAVNVVSHPFFPQFGEAASNFTYNFTLTDISQLVFSYDFFSPAVGIAPDPNYDIRQVGVSLNAMMMGSPNPIPIIADGIPVDAPIDQDASASSSVMLQPGDYSLQVGASARIAQLFGPTPAVTDPIPGNMTWDASFEVIDGQTQTTPFLPTGQAANGAWIFSDMPGGFWFDPIPADGFEFDILSGPASFTEAELPVGLGDSDGYIIEYMDGGMLVSTLVAAGDSIMFPAGVTSFQVLDIEPAFDPNDPLAFPIFLDFSTATASFSMTPILIPEPATLTLLVVGGIAVCRRRRTAAA